jgi:hypothetical protein
MISSLFGRKKITEEKLANIFVNSMLQAVDNSFGDVVDSIYNDPEFVKKPIIAKDDSDKFLMIVVVGNFSYLSRYFSNTEEMVLKGKITQKFAAVFGLSYDEMNTIFKDYSNFIYRVNHPSKNIIYGMSKAVFYKYKLGKFQDEYFAQLDAPNPLFLKRMDTLMLNYVWNWSTFLDKYKFTPVEAI